MSLEQILIINIADVIDPNDPQGRTYRQVNNERSHSIEIGELVEIVDTGVRLFIADRTRDCDGTPLYSLTAEQDKDLMLFVEAFFVTGYTEESLRICK